MKKYRDTKPMTWKEPGYDLPRPQSVLRHLKMDGLSRKTGRVPRHDMV